jgi:TolB-like protein/Flp pilus assembly protein TadD
LGYALTVATISFGPYVLNPGAGVTDADDRPVPINQRGLAILEILLGAQGKVVSKAELIERAWPGVIVEEGNLTVQIAALRKALGDAPDGGEWIITAPRVGYRMRVPKAATGQAQRAQADAPAQEPTIPSLAVLPFQNMSGDPGQEYFADGIADDIITALSRFRSFAVIARNSSFTYKGRPVDVRQVAKDLDVRYVLEGSVRRAGKRLRINAQLVDASDGAHLWAQNFEGALDEVFDFQDSITQSVAMIVEPRIQAAELERSRQERPGSLATYDLYLRALPKLHTQVENDNAEAYALLNEALKLEPDDALILAKSVWALGHRDAMGWPPIGPDDREKCAERARRASRLAPGDATVMAHCGVMLVHFIGDYDVGMAMVRAAAETNPNDMEVAFQAGIAHLHCGTIGDALACFHRAIRLSPRDSRSYFSLTGIAHAQMVLGHYGESLAWATRSLAINANFNPTYWMLVAANAHLGRMDEAHRRLDDFRRLAPGVTVAGICAGQPQMNPRRMANIFDGLRLAGLAETPTREPTIPSLAVLAFENMSGDPAQDYFADGVAGDIITALSRFKSFAVIARNSSFTYRGRAVDVRRVAKELGVRYVLEGSVRRAGDTLRITAQLVDGASGAHMWARNFDGAAADVFAFQDRITEAVATVVEPSIQAAELERSRRERPGSVAAYDLYMRALVKLYLETAEANAEAFALLSEALQIEPNNALLLANAQYALSIRTHRSWPPIGPDDDERRDEMSRRALLHAAGDSTVLALCGIVMIHDGRDYALAMALVREAAQANPNDLHVAHRAGVVSLHCGSLDDALAHFHRAIQLSPRDPRAYISLTGIAHVQMIRGEFEQALDWASRALALQPNYHPTHWMLIAANAHLGLLGEARRCLDAFRKLAPGISVARIWAGQPQMDPSRCANILDGLRRAGLE